MAAKQDFTTRANWIDQGADWSASLLWKDSDENPVDLTGYSAEMQIRSTVDAAEPLLTLQTNPKVGGGAGNGRITLGLVEETLGVPLYNILLEIENDATEDLAAGKWFYDLELVSGGGTVTRLIEGKIKVDPEVTRP